MSRIDGVWAWSSVSASTSILSWGNCLRALHGGGDRVRLLTGQCGEMVVLDQDHVKRPKR